ncbi:MAG: SDR family NAD(P)-dependent oxidoreductase [Armatimonadota bacterium]|nr:SDR family NAD(P)-dependent oxidoreductase [Armatimonadota bacterium]
MEKFGFIMHPLDAKRDIARKYPFVKFLPESWVEWGLEHKGPMLISHITGVKSATGAEAEGWFVGCPLTPKQMLSLPVDFVYKKIIDAGKIAVDLGAKIIGLGAFTSVVGDGGVTIANSLDCAVTTGNSFTVATAIEGAIKAAEMMDIKPSEAIVTVVGAGGSIGRTCAEIMSRQAAELILVDKNAERVEEVAADIRKLTTATISTTTDVRSGVEKADIVIAVSSAVHAIIEPSFIKCGAVVCDVARPRDVSVRVAQERDDVLVIEGGVVAVPGDVNFNFSFGFPPKTAYACMSETMMLALDGRYENFTLGRDLTVGQIDEIKQIGDKHGFRLAGFRSFERAVSEEQIERIRANAKKRNRSCQLSADS